MSIYQLANLVKGFSSTSLLSDLYYTLTFICRSNYSFAYFNILNNSCFMLSSNLIKNISEDKNVTALVS